MEWSLGNLAIMSAPESALAEFLHAKSLAPADDDGVWTPLAGGVSSDIWRVDAGGTTFCVKRALAQLRVAADWKAPVERNGFEWAYMKVVDRIAPGQVPRPLAQDEERGLFAMAWLGEEQFTLWKSDLLAGNARVEDAAAVGDLLGRIHAATANNPDIPAAFATDESFHAIRIEPYLLATARAHPDLASRIHGIADVAAATRKALVHGDVSPKNILIGPRGPVLLDAECAWFGDPAFDLAFCLNHLVIKARVMTAACEDYLASFDELASTYLRHVDWESRATLERRAAALLPVLALARVDGKSPVEYLDETQRDALRATARRAICEAPETLSRAKALLVGAPGNLDLQAQ